MRAIHSRLSAPLRILASASLLLAGGALAQTTPAPKPAPAPASASAPAALQGIPRPAAPAQGNRPQTPTPEQLFADWDTDKNKQLSLAEFKEGLETARLSETIARLEMQFQAADANRTGMLEAGEYANLPVIKRAGAGAPPMSAFDANKNQSLDFREYLVMVQAMMKRNAPPAR